MNRLFRIFELDLPEKIFLAHCILTLCAVRLALSMNSASLIAEKISRIEVAAEADPHTAKLVAWGIGACAKFVPGATCLTQALAGQYLMARREFSSIVRIGIERRNHKEIRAHAWLLSGGFVVLGGRASDMSLYTNLVDYGLTR